MSPQRRRGYRVCAYDSFHLMGDAEKYVLGEFEDCASAVAACEKLVDDFLAGLGDEPLSAAAAVAAWAEAGPEPFIESPDPDCRFSAAAYLRRRLGPDS